MPENRVIFEPPDYDSRIVLDVLVRALTGKGISAFEKEIGDNCFGRYDDLYKEETNAAK